MTAWRWRIRKALWNAITRFKYGAVSPLPVKDVARLRRSSEPVTPIPLNQLYPQIPISNVLVADRVPKGDRAPRQALRLASGQVLQRLSTVISPVDASAPPVDSDPERAVDIAFTSAHRDRALRQARRFGRNRWATRRPVMPNELSGTAKLEALALRGPYAGYLHEVGNGEYAWDLRELNRFEHHDGVCRLGVRALFRADAATRSLSAFRIESTELGAVAPGDPGWVTATKLAMSAVVTHTGLTRHWNWVHQVGGEYLAIATWNHLPAAHPVRRLLHPHVFGTYQSNRLATLQQLMPGGEFEHTFGLTHRGVCDLVGHSVEHFDIRRFDPYKDAEARGLTRAGLELSTEVNLQRLFDVVLRHTTRYIAIYYAADQDVALDPGVAAWIEGLRALLPNGLPPASQLLSRDGLARLLAQCIYMVSAYHELVGSFLWNYHCWTHTHPLRVYRDGSRERSDVFQRALNANYVFNVIRAPLIDDFSCLAVDVPGQPGTQAQAVQAFRAFKQELEALQASMDGATRELWMLHPDALKANINA